jgi:hypothetical protein
VAITWLTLSERRFPPRWFVEEICDELKKAKPAQAKKKLAGAEELSMSKT